LAFSDSLMKITPHIKTPPRCDSARAGVAWQFAISPRRDALHTEEKFTENNNGGNLHEWWDKWHIGKAKKSATKLKPHTKKPDMKTSKLSKRKKEAASMQGGFYCGGRLHTLALRFTAGESVPPVERRPWRASRHRRKGGITYIKSRPNVHEDARAVLIYGVLRKHRIIIHQINSVPHRNFGGIMPSRRNCKDN